MFSLREFVLLMLGISLAMKLLVSLRRRDCSSLVPVLLTGLNLAMVLAAFVWQDVETIFYVAFAFFVLLVSVPSFLGNFARRVMQRADMRRALSLVRVREFVRGGAGQVIGVLERLQKADETSLEETITKGREQLLIGKLDDLERSLLVSCLTRVLVRDHRWFEAIELFEAEGGVSLASASPHVCVDMIRAFAESGDIVQSARCLALFEGSPARMEPAFSEMFKSARLAFLSFLGMVEEVRKLLSDPVSAYAKTRKPEAKLWLGLAYAQSGELEVARELLEEVASDQQNLEIASEAKWRLNNLELVGKGLRVWPRELQDFAANVFERAFVEQPIQPHTRLRLHFFKVAPVTTALLGSIGLVHVAVMLVGKSEDPWTLIRFGANFGLAVSGGEIWRLVSSMFLHSGLLHIALNGYALFLLGQLVERMYGSLRYFVIYMLAGICGSFVSALWGTQLHLSVGASGGIFGLLGAALVGLRQLRGRVPEEWRKKLTYNLLMVIGLQIVIGLSVKVIDNAAHLGGLVGGFVFGFVFVPGLVIPKKDWGKGFVEGLAVIMCLVILASGVLVALNGNAKVLGRIPSKVVQRGGFQAQCPIYWVGLSDDAPGLVMQDPLLLISPTLQVNITEPLVPFNMELEEFARGQSLLLMQPFSESEEFSELKLVPPVLEVVKGVVQTQIQMRYGENYFSQINLFRKHKNLLLIANIRLPQEMVLDFQTVVWKISATMGVYEK
ncbi:MAG: rhomboid family intramembrane serine protease [Pseudomonadota bacterium]